MTPDIAKPKPRSPKTAVNLSTPVSPLDFLLISVASLTLQVPLLRPSLWELFVAYAVHALVTIVFALGHRPLLFRYYPEFRHIVPDIDDEWFGSQSVEERSRVVKAAMTYPSKMATVVTVSNFIQVLPGLMIITFYWRHESSNLMQFCIAYSISVACFIYFFVATLVHAHLFLSKRIAQLHEKFDLGHSFREVILSSKRNDFARMEGWGLLYIWICTAFMAGAVWYRSSPWALPETLLVFTISLALCSRILLLGRRYFWDGFHSMLEMVDRIDPSKGNRPVPLHTVEALASLEKTFNSLTDRIANYHTELNVWVTKQAEESRINAMGEIAALVVHDLASPLHVIKNCVARLGEISDISQLEKYRPPLQSSVKQAADLIATLHTYLRHDTEITQLSIGAALKNVLSILPMRHSPKDFGVIQWTVDDRLDTVQPSLAGTELMQVLDNVLANSVKNLLDHSIKDARIVIQLRDRKPDVIELTVTDNGTGLSSSRFESLTGWSTPIALNHTQGSSMGLRLVRRIVERHNGSLSVDDSSSSPGTVFVLKLPV